MTAPLLDTPNAAAESPSSPDTGLAQAISVDRVLHEGARKLRLSVGADRIVMALVGGDSDTAAPRLAYHAGVAEAEADTESTFRRRWQEALAHPDTPVIVRRNQELEVGIVGHGSSLTCVASFVLDASEDPAAEAANVASAAEVVNQIAAALDRAEAVRRLVEKRRLDAAGEMAAGVAQELRNPLSGVSSAAQLLRFRVQEDPVVETNVGRILREVERLNALASALRDFGRIAPLRLATADPDQLWDDVLQEQRGLLESKAIVVRRAAAEPRGMMSIDAEQLRQAFAQVLANAIEAAPEGSDLALTASRTAAGAWRCRLHNDGPSLSDEHLTRAFDLFFSTKAGRSGLGLALSQRIVEAHGGTMALTNAPGGGVDVTLMLPPSPSPASPPSSHRDTPAVHG